MQHFSMAFQMLVDFIIFLTVLLTSTFAYVSLSYYVLNELDFPWALIVLSVLNIVALYALFFYMTF